MLEPSTLARWTLFVVTQYIFDICATVTRTTSEQLLLVLLSPVTLCTQAP